MGGIRKQYRTLGGHSVLYQTVSVFASMPEISCVIVAVPQDALSETRNQLDAGSFLVPVQVVEGGTSRQKSVWKALQQVSNEEIVLVHDAVRPFLSPTDVRRVIRGTAEQGAAALAIPVVDTLRRGYADVFAEMVPRDGLFRTQTPQGVRTEVFRTAHQKALAENRDATDDVALVQHMGISVRILDGSPWNIKITTSEDWDFAETFWPIWQQMRNE